MPVAPIRFPRVDVVTEFALRMREASLGRVRLLRIMQKRFPSKDAAELEPVARRVAKIRPEHAGYQYMCSNFTDDEWERFAKGEDEDRIYIDRLPGNGEGGS